MKSKLVIIAAAVAVASVATADVSVLFNNGIGFLKAGEIAPPNATKVVPAGQLVQLIWRADNVGYQSGNMTELVDSGDFLLSSGAGDIRAQFNFGSIVKADADVGGANINEGYFFARIFSDSEANILAGTTADFLEVGIQGPALKVFDSLTPSTGYSEDMGAEYAAWTAMDVQGTTITVIPEPATLGLMGIAGLGMFLARKKARK